jgi:uncharacterized protein YfiM (DUF2279 family)
MLIARSALMKCKFVFTLLFVGRLAFANHPVLPNDSTKDLKTRRIVFATGSVAAAAGSLMFLNEAWYKPYSSSGFHFFNDNSEWLQMDKVGHAFSCYQVGRLMMQSMQWAGFSERQSTWIGGTSGLMYMTVIELMDGRSSGWGFSWGDMCANAVGSALAVSQQQYWKEQRVSLKFSFHQTDLWQYRPNLLGSTLPEQVIKDYNGQTYWLSFNIRSFFKKSNFPSWINFALGYGANNMIGGNNFVLVTRNGEVIGNDRYRRCLLSLDVDLTKIKTKSKFLKGVLSALNCIKIPFPAIEFSRSKVNGYIFYY